jgi:hypothetical protein
MLKLIENAASANRNGNWLPGVTAPKLIENAASANRNSCL